MSIAMDVILDKSIVLPDGRENTGNFETWEFGGLWEMRYRIDVEGRLWREWKPEDANDKEDLNPERVPLHGFFEFEFRYPTQHRYTARFTYGVLDGIMLGEQEVWNTVHSD